MNERITELMIDAGKTIPGEKHIDADFCKKFAELIVRECISKAEDYGLGCDAVEQLKEHFGVEE